MPILELVERAEIALDEVIDLAGRATIEAVRADAALCDVEMRVSPLGSAADPAGHAGVEQDQARQIWAH